MTQSTANGYASLIPAHVHACMDVLAQEGYESYLVGGAVRDMVLGSTPTDFDLATDATPDQMLAAFRDYTTIPTGLSHGTLTVLSSGQPVEITTYRVDGPYSDARRPDSVIFSRSLKEDVKRRDFTINALAMDGQGLISDFVGGRDDLANRIIRCVGDPDLRIKEDALRIMRALRFSSVLGFSIEDKTRASLFANKDLLVHISAERIRAELSGLLRGQNTSNILLEYSTILGVFIPEILPMIGFRQYNPYHMYDVWEHTVQVVENTPPENVIRLAALFHDSGKPYTFVRDGAGVGHFYGHQKISRDIAHTVLLRLKADTRSRERVETLVLWHDIAIEPSVKNIRRRLFQFGEDVLRDLLTLKRADTLGQSDKSRYRLEELTKIQVLLEKILADKACFSMKDLAINGKDLIAAGAKPGTQIGAALTLALNAVIDDDMPNDHDALMAFIRSHTNVFAQ